MLSCLISESRQGLKPGGFSFCPLICGTGAGFTPFTAPAGSRGNRNDNRSDSEDGSTEEHAHCTANRGSVRTGGRAQRPCDGQGASLRIGEDRQWLRLDATRGNGGCSGRTASGETRRRTLRVGSAVRRSITRSSRAQRPIAGSQITASLFHIIQSWRSYRIT